MSLEKKILFSQVSHTHVHGTNCLAQEKEAPSSNSCLFICLRTGTHTHHVPPFCSCTSTVAVGQLASRLQLTCMGRPATNMNDAARALSRLLFWTCMYYSLRVFMFVYIDSLDPSSKGWGWDPVPNQPYIKTPMVWYALCALDDLFWYAWFGFSVWILRNVRYVSYSNYYNTLIRAEWVCVCGDCKGVFHLLLCLFGSHLFFLGSSFLDYLLLCCLLTFTTIEKECMSVPNTPFQLPTTCVGPTKTAAVPCYARVSWWVNS
jgi:hypothetical protein